MLDKEFKYYIDHQNDLVKSHFGRFIIIKDDKVLGDFATQIEAIKYAKDALGFALGSFLVQQCLPGRDNYTNFYSSRIVGRPS